MSYYCKGTICKRAKECLRAKFWREFPDKNVREGYASGVWFVPEKKCIQNNHEDGVFKTTNLTN